MTVEGCAADPAVDWIGYLHRQRPTDCRETNCVRILGGAQREQSLGGRENASVITKRDTLAVNAGHFQNVGGFVVVYVQSVLIVRNCLIIDTADNAA